MSERNHILYPKKFSTDIDAFKSVLLDDNLSKSDLKVFMFLCTVLESARPQKLDKGQIADTLNISKKSLNESLDTLIQEGIIIESSDESVRKGYRFTYIEKYSGK